METQVGPLIHEQHYNKVMGYIERAKAAGAKLVCGGNRVIVKGRCEGGFFVEPTVFDGLTDDMEIVKEEVFGPVMAVLSFKTEEEAIARANDTPFGLAAGVMTTNLARGHRVVKRLQVSTTSPTTHSEL